MAGLKEGLPALPEQLAHLPIDENGYPVPWFVAKVNGIPDHRAMDPAKLERALQEKRCWTCGAGIGAHKVFAIGPMCAVNRVTAEPPSHLACAQYSVRACPWLTSPKRRRRETQMPEGSSEVGEMIKRNPGVTLLWTTKKFRPFRVGQSIMFQLGEPTELAWFCRGRGATRDEIDLAMESGYPILRESAASDGPEASAELEAMIVTAQKYLPARVGA